MMENNAPIPTVDPADLKQFWKRSREIAAEHPPGPNTAIGAGVLGFDVKARGPGFEATFLSIWKRYMLIASLVERGFLESYRNGDQMREEVFQAGASMPCVEEEVFEVLALPMFLSRPDATPVDIARLKEEVLAEGIDLDKPKVAEKFIAWIQNSV